MPFESADFPACLWIPEFDRLVITARSQYLAVWTKTHAIDRVIMTPQAIVFTFSIEKFLQDICYFCIVCGLILQGCTRLNCFDESFQLLSFIK